jgi:hypothetical protein
LEIDPLIRNNYQKCGDRYNENNTKIKVIQSYADDILIFSDTKEHLNRLTEGLISYMNYSHINFNTKKCKILLHNSDKVTRVQIQLPDAGGNVTDVETCNIKDVNKYLVILLRTRKLQKM